MESFDLINRANAEYVERLYYLYNTNPSRSIPQWRAFFAGFDMAGGTKPTADTHLPGLPAAAATPLSVEIADLVHSYRELGHVIADLDPLGHRRHSHPLLDLGEFGLGLSDLERTVGCGGFLGACDGTLRDLIEKLRLTYCSTMGVEYMEIPDKTQRDWLTQRMEPNFNRPKLSTSESIRILRQIIAAQGFEEFLGLKFGNLKRFSVEGAESLIPLLNTIVDDGSGIGVDEFVIGMAHRGRLNVLANVLNKPIENMLVEIEGRIVPDTEHEGDGDVKYHLGYSKDRITQAGRNAHLALSYNPSHLELVNPVVEGIVRGKQYYLGDNDRVRVVPILIHGDAAFCGQGIVQECLALSEMPYWRTGGTIHIIVNNQIGFTTMPKQGRFTPYPTDVAKMIQAPIFHVNGDDPEAVVHAAKLAIAFRQQFHCDVFIDLWCYRRWGHNEGDEAAFTQPLMYKEIGAHATLREIYAKKLIDEKKIEPHEVERMKSDHKAKMEGALTTAREHPPKHVVGPFGGVWHGMSRAPANLADWNCNTRVSAEMVKRIGDVAGKLPEGFTPHPKLRKIVQSRGEMSQGKMPIDWGTAEMFALGSLVLEGVPVRFVGQDAQRGTFSHRHAALHDYENGQKWYPLANLSPDQAPIIFVNTMLSELAVLGFEYGFSSSDPRNLVIWEAQFGDFVNGAQAIIDQFIAAAESKWGKMCGLVMLLPHGWEGAGPEHSNAYLERFLSLCAENNMQVCVPSLPGQYFHLLRKQMLRNFRKPLILMMPKSLLRHEASTSKLEELTTGAFANVLDDPTNPARESVRRVLLCSGKVYFTLAAARAKHAIKDTAIVRVEQLYPFAEKELQAIIAKYRNAVEFSWVQEEPQNRGAWTFIDRRLRQLMPDGRVCNYYGREASASPAVGSHKLHLIEEEEFVGLALEIPNGGVPVSEAPKAVAAVDGANGGGNDVHVAREVK